VTYALYITHPQVQMDPTVPVPRWSLSEKGRARAEAFARHSSIACIKRIVSSHETKARELAELLAAASGAAVESGENFGENDRSSTGFLLPEKFEATADAFFANPTVSIDGWETARDAQARIVAAVVAVLERHDLTAPIAFAGHGAVGTLLKCHLGGRPISRAEDQRRIGDPGGGNVFVFRFADLALLTDWVAMEKFELPAL